MKKADRAKSTIKKAQSLLKKAQNKTISLDKMLDLAERPDWEVLEETESYGSMIPTKVRGPDGRIWEKESGFGDPEFNVKGALSRKAQQSVPNDEMIKTLRNSDNWEVLERDRLNTPIKVKDPQGQVWEKDRGFISVEWVKTQ